MLSRLKGHLNPATAISALALFVVLGGVAVAGNTITGSDVTNNSLTGYDIKDISSGDIKDSRIKTEDIKDGTLTSSDIADGTIASGDVAANTFETADSRPNATITVRTSTLTVGVAGEAGVTVTCNSDEIVISGGWGNESNATEDVDDDNVVTENRRDGNGWRVQVKDDALGNGDSVTVRADCAKLS